MKYLYESIFDDDIVTRKANRKDTMLEWLTRWTSKYEHLRPKRGHYDSMGRELKEGDMVLSVYVDTVRPAMIYKFDPDNDSKCCILYSEDVELYKTSKGELVYDEFCCELLKVPDPTMLFALYK